MARRDEMPADPKAVRAEKLAAALRENLKRRKQQARLREAGAPAATGGEEPSPGQE